MTELKIYQKIESLEAQLLKIENTPSNYLGGIKAYMTGHKLTYTTRAEQQRAKIKQQINQLEQFITEA